MENDKWSNSIVIVKESLKNGKAKTKAINEKNVWYLNEYNVQ